MSNDDPDVGVLRELLLDDDLDCTYRIVRMYFRDEHATEILTRGLTLAQAQAHCQDPETSSSTATNSAGVERTERCGPWFDGYEKEIQ